MSLISPIYNRSNVIQTDISRKNPEQRQNKNIGFCYHCKTYKPTKILSKVDRKKFRMRKHPICNKCRRELTKQGIYSKILSEIMSRLKR